MTAAKKLASKINTEYSFSKFVDRRQENSTFLNQVKKNEKRKLHKIIRKQKII